MGTDGPDADPQTLVALAAALPAVPACDPGTEGALDDLARQVLAD